MDDHDQRFKRLLREFLVEFLALFFPRWAAILDSTLAIWLEQELFIDPIQGQKKILDLVARIPLRVEGQPLTPALLLMEVESGDSVSLFRPRVYSYTHHLGDKHQLEVLPIAVFLGVAMEGLGQDVHERRIGGQEQMTFRYDYVGLPGLDGSKYLQGSNLLGVALSALMRWPRAERVAAALKALEKIVGSNESGKRKMMLCECIQAYAPLDPEQRMLLTDLLDQPERKGMRMAFKTWSEEGREAERFRLLKLQIEARFQTPLTESARQRLQSWPVDRLDRLAVDLFKAGSLKELGLED